MSAEPDDRPKWLDALRDLAPVEPSDPWGDRVEEEQAHPLPLSEDQRAFLSALKDMPEVPRLQDVDETAVLNDLPEEIINPDDVGDILG